MKKLIRGLIMTVKERTEKTIKDLADRKERKKQVAQSYIANRQNKLMRQQRTKQGYRYTVGQI